VAARHAIGRRRRLTVYMTANVPTLGVTTLYATVVGDALPQACLALLVYLAVALRLGEDPTGLVAWVRRAW
jgi:hypothetical protein